MKNKSKELFVVIIFFLFTFNTFGLILNNFQVPNKTYKNSEKPYDKDTLNKETTDEEPINIEPPKTADISQEQQEHNFSLSININDGWNESWYYKNCNSTKNVYETSLIAQLGTQGYNVSYELNIFDITNTSSSQLIYPSDLHYMSLFINVNGTPQGWVNLSLFNDNGLGKGIKKGYLCINESFPGFFAIFNLWDEDVNITYNATMTFSIIANRTIITEFIPTVENTQSNEIKWEFNLTKSFLSYSGWDYYIKIYLDDEFTLIRALGTDDSYWIPVETIRTPTEIILNETYNEYLIEVSSLNYVSIVYNNNLTFQNLMNELQLYATCKLAGNLTIKFRLTNGSLLYYTKLVEQDEVIYFNYAMPLNMTGGIGSLNVTLTDDSQPKFGVKICEVTFYKQCHFEGMTSNTTAFSQFFVAMGYIDFNLFIHYIILNSTGKININEMEMLNLSIVPNAIVTYELGELQGELDYKFLGGFFDAPNITAYWDILDLSEYQIVPGEYNMIYRASRPGYQTLVFNDTIIISEKEVYIKVESVDNTVAIEEDFLWVFNLQDNESRENFLRTPVYINFSFTNNDTKEVAVEGQWGLPAIQSITIQDTMDNETPPGTYNLTIYIDSEYYYGETSWILYIVKKELDISVDHDTSIRAGANTNFTWSLEDNNFQGNRANMTFQIIVDGQLFREFNLTSNSTGWTIFNFGSGTHNITYRIVSPFYEAETTVLIQAVSSSIIIADGDDDDDDDDKEENLLLWLIAAIIIIGISCLALWLLISRYKLKAKRELDSELVALKTKATAQEQKMSLIESQIAEIVSIYWIIIVHSEQGTTMVEIADFRFEEVLGEKYKDLIGRGELRDSALIGGFLTAIRNFSRETSGTSMEYQPVFNSQTDYSTIVDNNEIHRRILEGTHHFMAFVSSRGTMEISDILAAVNSIFQDNYGEIVKSFSGAISPFKSYNSEVISYLHNQIRELQNKFSEEQMLLEHFNRHLREVQDKIGIKPKKSAGTDYK